MFEILFLLLPFILFGMAKEAEATEEEVDDKSLKEKILGADESTFSSIKEEDKKPTIPEDAKIDKGEQKEPEKKSTTEAEPKKEEKIEGTPIPAELLEKYPYLSKFKTMEAFAKGNVELEKKLGVQGQQITKIREKLAEKIADETLGHREVRFDGIDKIPEVDASKKREDVPEKDDRADEYISRAEAQKMASDIAEGIISDRETKGSIKSLKKNMIDFASKTDDLEEYAQDIIDFYKDLPPAARLKVPIETVYEIYKTRRGKLTPEVKEEIKKIKEETDAELKAPITESGAKGGKARGDTETDPDKILKKEIVGAKEPYDDFLKIK